MRAGFSLLAVCALAPNVDARESLAGAWSAGALTEAWSFPAWPAACGPKPSPQNSPGGSLSVTEESGELVFSGPGRAYKTTQCFEQYPGLRRVAHSRSATAWSNTCKSAQGDPRQANLRTSVTLQGETVLKFRETGSYEFYIASAKCLAQVTRTRTYTRAVAPTQRDETPAPGAAEEARGADFEEPSVGARGASAALDLRASSAEPEGPAGAAKSASRPSPAAPTLAPGEEPKPSGGTGEQATQRPLPVPQRRVRHDCPSVGAPHEIRTAGPIPWLQPGATQRLSPVLVDAEGCVVAKGPFTYAVEPATEAVRVGARNGVVRVSPDAEEGTYSIVIRSGGLREVIEIPVVTRQGLAAFLEGPFEDAVSGETRGSVVAPPEVLGSAEATAEDHATPRKWWFVGLAGLVTLGLGALGLRLLRAGSRPIVAPAAPRNAQNMEMNTLVSASAPPAPIARTSSTPPPKPSSRPNNAIPDPPSPSSSHTPRVCPQCGARYTDGSIFCGEDGNKLVDQGAWRPSAV